MGWIILLMFAGMLAAGVWFLGVRVPQWREEEEWFTARGAISRGAHIISVFFVSVWFAGARLGRTKIGAAVAFWLFVWLVIDWFWVRSGPDRVAPPLVGWFGFAVLACAYGYLELRHQRRWEKKVKAAHTAVKGQYRSEDVPVRFIGRWTGGMDYRFGLPPQISRGDLYDIEEQLRQRVPTHRQDVLSALAKRIPAAQAKALRLAREDQEEQRSRTWHYTFDLEDHYAFAEVVPGIPEMVDHPLASSPALSGDPARIPLGMSLDGIEYWDVSDLYGAGPPGGRAVTRWQERGDEDDTRVGSSESGALGRLPRGP